MEDSTQRLVEEASRGQHRAVDTLLERHLPGLRAFVRLRAGGLFRGRESASDLVQTVCREVLQHLGRFQYCGEAGFKHWLYTTAQRKIVERLRYYGRDKRDVRRDVTADDRADAQLLQAYATFHTPSQTLMAREEIERIERAFGQLSDEDREVITLSRIVGLSYRELASQLDRSEVAVRKALSRALARFARLLQTVA